MSDPEVSVISTTTAWTREWRLRNSYRIVGSIVEMKMTKDRMITFDKDNLERVLKQGKWCIQGKVKNQYVAATCRKNNKQRTIYMHRFLLNENSKEFIVDHIDGNPFHNCMVNLRRGTRCSNARNCKLKTTNKSGVNGVSLDTHSNAWRARLFKGDTAGWRFKNFSFGRNSVYTKDEAFAMAVECVRLNNERFSCTNGERSIDFVPKL